MRRDVDRQLIDTGHKLAIGGLVRGRSGNLSAREANGMRITVAGSRLGALRRIDLVTVPIDGDPIGERRPSSEVALHAAVYRQRPDVSAIVHTHSPYATAWASIAGRLELVLEEAAYYDMGPVVGVAPYAPAGGRRLAQLAVRSLADGAAVLLERHGAVTVGADPQTALDVAESLEHQAQVAWILECRRVGLDPSAVMGGPATAKLVLRTGSA